VSTDFDYYLLAARLQWSNVLKRLSRYSLTGRGISQSLIGQENAKIPHGISVLNYTSEIVNHQPTFVTVILINLHRMMKILTFGVNCDE